MRARVISGEEPEADRLEGVRPVLHEGRRHHVDRGRRADHPERSHALRAAHQTRRLVHRQGIYLDTVAVAIGH